MVLCDPPLAVCAHVFCVFWARHTTFTALRNTNDSSGDVTKHTLVNDKRDYQPWKALHLKRSLIDRLHYSPIEKGSGLRYSALDKLRPASVLTAYCRIHTYAMLIVLATQYLLLPRDPSSKGVPHPWHPGQPDAHQARRHTRQFNVAALVVHTHLTGPVGSPVHFNYLESHGNPF